MLLHVKILINFNFLRNSVLTINLAQVCVYWFRIVWVCCIIQLVICNLRVSNVFDQDFIFKLYVF